VRQTFQMLHDEPCENVLTEMRVVRGLMVVRRREAIIDSDHRSGGWDAKREGPAFEIDRPPAASH
jgi:hypothetical protein